MRVCVCVAEGGGGSWPVYCNTLHKHSVVTTQHDSTFDLVKFEGHTKNTCPHPTKKKKKKRASYRLGVNVSASQPLQVPAFIGP